MCMWYAQVAKIVQLECVHHAGAFLVLHMLFYAQLLGIVKTINSVTALHAISSPCVSRP